MRIVKSNVFVDFNPRSPHRERRRHIQPELETTLFQSTLPSQGATWNNIVTEWDSIFQSTLPSQGATYNDDETSRINFISIHAPLTGSDSKYTHKIPL